jgi:Cu+-exporting ATPase
MNVTTDPVCGMELNAENAPERAEYGGRTFYFCSDACRNKFDGEPARYAGAGAAGSDREADISAS